MCKYDLKTSNNSLSALRTMASWHHFAAHTRNSNGNAMLIRARPLVDHIRCVYGFGLTSSIAIARQRPRTFPLRIRQLNRAATNVRAGPRLRCCGASAEWVEEPLRIRLANFRQCGLRQCAERRAQLNSLEEASDYLIDCMQITSEASFRRR